MIKNIIDKAIYELSFGTVEDGYHLLTSNALVNTVLIIFCFAIIYLCLKELIKIWKKYR